MKIKDFIRTLQDLDEDEEIYIIVDTNDYWQNRLALPISCIEELLVQRSAYYNGQLKVVVDSDPDVQPVIGIITGGR